MHSCRRKGYWVSARIWGDWVECFHNRPSIPNPSTESYSNGKTREDGNVIDPFSGQGLDKPCGTIREILWSPPLAYEPVSIYAAGFQSGTPRIENLSIDASSPD